MSRIADQMKCSQCGYDEDVSYFSSDLSRFACGNCAKECELSDDTPVVYGDIPIPFCSDECEAEWLAREDPAAR